MKTFNHSLIAEVDKTANLAVSDSATAKADSLKPGTLAIACACLKICPHHAKAICRQRRDITAKEVMTYWNYRAAGYKTLKAALAAIAEAVARCEYRSNRPRRKKRGSKNSDTRFLRTSKIRDYYFQAARRYEERRQNRDNLCYAPLAHSISEAGESLADWQRGRVKISLETGFVLLTREESVTWDDKSKWPASRSIKYRAKLISPEMDTTAECEFSRRGDWLAEVASGLGLQKGNRTALTQSAAMIPVETANRHGVSITTLRAFGNGFCVYAAEAAGNNYHAKTRQAAVAGLFAKIRANGGNRKLRGSQVLTRDDARAAGFCAEGTSAFLAEIGLEHRKSATVWEIRRMMRGRDLTPWAEEIEKIGL